ncbi:MAG: hypothetical protein ABH826_02235 [Patescibacteria group bacterium]
MPGPENPMDPSDIQFEGEPSDIPDITPPDPTVPAIYLTPGSPYTEVFVDVDKNLSVISGVPVMEGLSQPDFKIIAIPHKPHVFMVHELWLNQKSDGQKFLLNNVPIIFGHGHQTNEGWKFADGSSVVDTIEALDRHCDENNLPKVEWVASCNDALAGDESGVNIIEFDSWRPRIQVAGEPLDIPTGGRRFYKNGAVVMEFEAKRFENLPELLVHRQVKPEGAPQAVEQDDQT